MMIGLLLAGVLLGPLYAVYGAFLSGQPAGEYDVQIDEPVAIRLGPEMNPIAIDVTYEHVRQIPQPNSRYNIYEGEWREGPNQIWSGQINLDVPMDSEPTTKRWGSPETSRMTSWGRCTSRETTATRFAFAGGMSRRSKFVVSRWSCAATWR